MVNQVQYHVGMGAGYPETTPGFWKRMNITIMAYSPLAGGKLLKSGSDFAPLGKSLGSKYNVTAAQIALGWIGQPAQFAPTGPMAIVTKSSNPQYLAVRPFAIVSVSLSCCVLSGIYQEDLSLWNWKAPLSDEDREILDKVASPACVEEAPGGCCKGQ